MLNSSATCSIALRDVQPPACSCARHSSGITAEAWRPSGYFASCCFAQARFSAVKENSFGCNSVEARRRTDTLWVLALIHSNTGQVGAIGGPSNMNLLRPKLQVANVLPFCI